MIEERLVGRFPRFRQRVVGSARAPAGLRGRPLLRPRQPPAPAGAALTRRPGGPPGARRRSDHASARPRQAALAHLPDRRLRGRRGDALAHPPLPRGRDRAGRGDALDHRRRRATAAARGAQDRRRSPRAWRRSRARPSRRPRRWPAPRSTRARRRSPIPGTSASWPRGRSATSPPRRSSSASPEDRPSVLRQPLSGARRVAWSAPFPLQRVKDACHHAGSRSTTCWLSALAATIGEQLRRPAACRRRSTR